MIPHIFKNLNIAGPTGDYRGKVLKMTTPKRVYTKEGHRGSGMAGEVQVRMGIELPEMDIVFGGFTPELYETFNTHEIDGCQFIAYGAYEDDKTCDIKQVTFTVRGRANEEDLGEWAAGSKAEATTKFSPTYSKCEMNGKVIWEVDLINGIDIDHTGKDRQAETRKALGMQ